MSDRKKNGDKSEAIFLMKSVLSEYQISKPFSEDCAYDYILDDGSNLNKIQVKTAYDTIQRGKSIIMCELRRVNNKKENQKYKKGDYDYLVAIHIKTKDMWYIPYNDIQDKKCGICLSSEKWDKYKKWKI